MATYYYAAFIPYSNAYAIIVPDLPEVASQGGDIAECMDMATDAVRCTVEEYGKARKTLPKPSDMDTARHKIEKELASLGETVPEGVVLQLIPAPSVDLTPVKISISVARSTLDSIDAKASAYGMTRSGFLARAAQEFQTVTSSDQMRM